MAAVEPFEQFLHRPRGLVIGGIERPAASGRWFEVTNPATGQPLATVAEAGAADIDAAVAAARAALPAWAALAPQRRADLLWALGARIEELAAEFARLEALDNGKPTSESLAVDVPLCAGLFKYYAGWDTKIGGETITPGRRCAAARLHPARAGRRGRGDHPVELPAPDVRLQAGPGAGRREHRGAEAGRADTAVRAAAGSADRGDRLPAWRGERGSWLRPGSGRATGRAPGRGQGHLHRRDRHRPAHPGGGQGQHETAVAGAGRQVAQRDLRRRGSGRGRRGHLRRGLLQPGPVLHRRRPGVRRGGGARRVPEAAGRPAAAVRLGPGLDPETTMGPLVSAEQRDRVLSLVQSGLDEGATALLGGGPVADPALAGGYYVTPTILTGVTPQMRVMREEIFGPVAMVSAFLTEDEAVAAANDTSFGLASGVWTRDIKRGHRMAAAIRAGLVWINTYGWFDPAVPYGGFRLSGFGKELGREALDSYLQTKTVWVELS